MKPGDMIGDPVQRGDSILLDIDQVRTRYDKKT
jgi:hypothetical protein